MAMRAKCRQGPSPPFSQIFLKRVPPSGSAAKKISTLTIVFRQQVWMFHLPFDFVRDHEQLQARLFPSNSSAAPAAQKLKR